jgi:hypothetical protein
LCGSRHELYLASILTLSLNPAPPVPFFRSSAQPEQNSGTKIRGQVRNSSHAAR